MQKRIIKIISLILALILLSGIIVPVVSEATEETVTITFKDKNLYNAMIKEIGSKLSGKDDSTNTIVITRRNLNSINFLAFGDRQISDISGLSSFTNLTSLTLQDNQISDISELSSLTNLTMLRLDVNQIRDISGLSSLTNLTELDLYNNQISDISGLSSLTNLTRLTLHGNQISDISGLSSLTNLTTLALHDNQISDISGLSSLTNLTTLYLEGNQISDISGLSSLTNLTKLYLDNNQISNIRLSNLTNLTVLKLYNNQIRDIRLSNLTNLTRLDLYNNQISDISGLSSLTNLTELSLGYNQIRDISGLRNLTNLTYLSLGSNQISDISGLSSLTNLDRLYLNNNTIYSKVLPNTIKREEIPNIFKEALNPQSVVFSADGLEYYNCTVNENGDITLQDDKIVNSLGEARVRIKDGNASGTTWHIQVADTKVIQFNDQNLYNIMKEIMPLYQQSRSGYIPAYAYKMDDQNKTLTIMQDYIDKIDYLDLSKLDIEDVSGLQEFTNLHTLILDDNKVKNIEILSQLPLDTLQISNNDLKDFSKLKDFKSVKTLIAKNNNFENINSIENLTNLKILNLAENKITNISELSTLPEIEYIHMNNNKITDVSVLENVKYNYVNFKENNIEKYGNFDFGRGYFENNQITKEIIGIKELELPDIFLKAQNSSSKVYSPDSLICDGCEIQGNKVIIEKGVKEAKVVISSGIAKGTILKIVAEEDVTPPNISVNYKLSSDKSKMTVTITANEDIKDVWGWDRINTQKVSKTFEYNVENQNIVIEDLYGNKTNTIIDFSGVIRDYNEENEALSTQYYVKFDTAKPTNKDVAVTITSKGANPMISLPHSQGDRGWTISDDRQTLTKVFQENEDTTVELINEGKTISIPISISNIDREAPVCTVEYSTTSLTNNRVVVTIVSDEDIQTVQGWNKRQRDDKYILYHFYYKNADENITVYDLAGNPSIVNVKVANIDKGILNLTQQYSMLSLTRNNIDVKIKADENIQEVNETTNTRATMRARQVADTSSNTIDKTYSENIIDAITVKDAAENEDFVPVGIYNIDKTELTVGNPEYTQNKDGTVTVKIVANKTINPIEGWNGWDLDSSKKVLTKVYSSNKKETLKVTDMVGNEVDVEIDVNTINPGLEIISVTVEKVETEINKEIDDEKFDYDYEFSKHEQTGEYKVTITASNEIKDIYGWEKSFDGRSISKLFSEDGKETVEIEDYYGNKKTVEIDVRKLLNIKDNDVPNEGNQDKKEEQANKNLEENKDQEQNKENQGNKNQENNTQRNNISPKTGDTIFIDAIILAIAAIVGVVWSKNMRDV